MPHDDVCVRMCVRTTASVRAHECVCACACVIIGLSILFKILAKPISKHSLYT